MSYNNYYVNYSARKVVADSNALLGQRRFRFPGRWTRVASFLHKVDVVGRTYAIRLVLDGREIATAGRLRDDDDPSDLTA